MINLKNWLPTFYYLKNRQRLHIPSAGKHFDAVQHVSHRGAKRPRVSANPASHRPRNARSEAQSRQPLLGRKACESIQRRSRRNANLAGLEPDIRHA